MLDMHVVTSPPVPVLDVAEKMGLKVVLKRAEDDLSGFLLRDERHHRTIIGVNRRHHPNRRRFTIAHEIGHYLLHRGEELHVDRVVNGYQIKLRDSHSSEGTEVDEMEANLFAAELLMPIQFIDADLAKYAPLCLSDDDKIKMLSLRYGVSTQALTLRLTYLGCIPY